MKGHHFVHKSLPCLRSCVTFSSFLAFYNEELLVPHPTPKKEDHLLSAVSDLFIIFTAILPLEALFHLEHEDMPCLNDKRPT